MECVKYDRNARLNKEAKKMQIDFNKKAEFEKFLHNTAGTLKEEIKRHEAELKTDTRYYIEIQICRDETKEKLALIEKISESFYNMFISES
jgi:hypothetical protein